MITHKIILTIALQFFILVNLFSQENTDISLLKENTYHFEVEDNQPKGEGFNIIESEIKNAQFVILGEEHFSEKVSEFTNSIVPILKQNQFNYFACEIGPNSANELTRQIQEEQSLYKFNSNIFNLVGEVPIPFFDGVEDELFLKAFIKNDFEIWGIDQEYLTAQVFLIDRLYDCSNKLRTVKKSYHKAKELIISETSKRQKDKTYKLFTSLLNSSEINHFFEQVNSNQNKTIISDLKQSWRIYQQIETKNWYKNNHLRAQLMKDNFTRYYNDALTNEQHPKVFLKIGGVHASKGRSVLNIYDIGNFMMELANYNQQKSLHILIFPNSYFNKNSEITKNIEEQDEELFNSVVDFKSKQWTVIDLKTIQQQSWKQKINSESLKDYMYRFDYIVLTPTSKQTQLNYLKGN